MTPDGRRAYVTNAAPDTVSVIDTATDTVTGAPSRSATARRGGGDPGRTPRLRDQLRLRTRVSVIDTATDTRHRAPSRSAPSPDGVAVTPDGRRAYVTNAGSDDSVSVIDTATNRTATIPVGDAPSGWR